MEGGSLSSIEYAVHNGIQVKREQLSKARQVWKFNGVANLAADPLFQVQRDQSVIIEVINRTGFYHAMHVHGHHFQVSGRPDSTPMAPGAFRDTFVSEPITTDTIAFVADNPGKWLLHCHMLEHAAAGMRTWFEVV
jgi:FtsP/CotA-like multicopper oxidase with cupredoxin domain